MSNINCSSDKRCTILLKEDVYKRLKTKGKFGESFSDLVTRILDNLDKVHRGKIEMTPSDTVIDILSRDCKYNKHRTCNSRWQGFGFEIVCYCSCHQGKKEKTLEVAPNSATNAIESQPSIEVKQDG